MRTTPVITYVAKHTLRVGEGWVHLGEGFPAQEVTHSLIGVGYVSEGVGTMPKDEKTHELFQAVELAQHAASHAPLA